MRIEDGVRYLEQKYEQFAPPWLRKHVLSPDELVFKRSLLLAVGSAGALGMVLGSCTNPTVPQSEKEIPPTPKAVSTQANGLESQNVVASPRPSPEKSVVPSPTIIAEQRLTFPKSDGPANETEETKFIQRRMRWVLGDDDTRAYQTGRTEGVTTDAVRVRVAPSIKEEETIAATLQFGKSLVWDHEAYTLEKIDDTEVLSRMAILIIGKVELSFQLSALDGYHLRFVAIHNTRDGEIVRIPHQPTYSLREIPVKRD